MAISRSQMKRQLYMGGGITQLPVNQMMVPRGEYGLGSIVKSVGKAVKGATKAVKNIVSSDVGKLALLAGGAYYLGGLGGAQGLARFSPSALKTGLLGTVEAGTGLYGGGLLSGVMNTGVGQALTSGSLLSKVPGGMGTIAAVGGGLLGSLFGGSKEKAQEAFARDPQGVKNYLVQYFKNLNKDATDEEAAQFAEEQTREYAAQGGRIGYADGSYKFMELIDKDAEEEYYKRKAEELDRKYNPEKYQDKKRKKKAVGGIMDIPMGQPRENQQGVQELDYRAEGGFVPVGIKEKADDVPAMLSKNEFVFTADAVRGAGNGDVEKGAERLYNTMKTLENGGTV